MKKLKDIFRKISDKLFSIKDNPQNIASGYALGIFLATTPFIGLKVIIALIISHKFNWSKIAAIVGVYHINTLNAAFFYGLAFLIGNKIMGYNTTFIFPEELSFRAIIHSFSSSYEVFISLLIGGLIIGIPLSIIAYKFIISLLYEHKTAEVMGGKYALVTGASKGLGYHLAFELARRNYNLLLVSLHDEGLDEMTSNLKRKFGIDVQFMESDLSINQSVYDIANWANKFPVSVLVNNAGVGGTKAFDSASSDYLEQIIDINVRTTTILTHQLLPLLKKQTQGFILNVASMASFSPIAYKTVYPASKAFIWNFSRCLYQELKNTNVFVSVIHPGPMKTNPDVTARIEKQGFFGKIGLLSTEKMAEIAIRQLLRRDNLVIPGFLNKINWLIMQIVPIWLRLIILSKVVSREIKQTPELSQEKNY